MQRATAAEERTELAESSAVQLQQTVADLERILREQTERANRAERGSVSVQFVQAHHERMEAIVAENAGGRRPSRSRSRSVPGRRRRLRPRERREHGMAGTGHTPPPTY